MWNICNWAWVDVDTNGCLRIWGSSAPRLLELQHVLEEGLGLGQLHALDVVADLAAVLEVRAQRGPAGLGALHRAVGVEGVLAHGACGGGAGPLQALRAENRTRGQSMATTDVATTSL